MPNLDPKTVTPWCPDKPNCVTFKDVYGQDDSGPPAGYEYTGHMVQCGPNNPLTTVLGSSGGTIASNLLDKTCIRAELRKLPEAPRPFVETRTVTFKDVYGVDYIEPPTGFEYTGRMIDTQGNNDTPVLARNGASQTYGPGDAGGGLGYIRAELRTLPEPPKPVKWQFEVETRSARTPLVLVHTGEYRMPKIDEWFEDVRGNAILCNMAQMPGAYTILKQVIPTRTN